MSLALKFISKNITFGELQLFDAGIFKKWFV